jgi:hypothetical protein
LGVKSLKKTIIILLSLLLLTILSACQAKSIKEFLPGAYPIVKVMLGNDERTLFTLTSEHPLNKAPLVNWTPVEKTQISNYEQKLVLIDAEGFKSTFFELPTNDQSFIVVSNSKGNEVKYYASTFGFADSIIEELKINYPAEFIIDELPKVKFTYAFLDGLENFAEAKMMALNQVMSDKINSILKLPTRYRTNITPDFAAIKPYILKDENGVYYVICFQKNMIGVGSDPTGVLTYYAMDLETASLIGNYFYFIPVNAPAGKDLSDLTLKSFNSQLLGTYAEQFIELSARQSQEVLGMLDLPRHAFVTLELDVDSYDDLFGFEDGDGLLYWFFRSNQASKTFLRVDYGANESGLTYYEYSFEGRDTYTEVMQYLKKLIKK